MARPKSVKRKTAAAKTEVVERVIIKEVPASESTINVTCVNCQNMKGIGPASEWDK